MKRLYALVFISISFIASPTAGWCGAQEEDLRPRVPLQSHLPQAVEIIYDQVENVHMSFVSAFELSSKLAEEEKIAFGFVELGIHNLAFAQAEYMSKVCGFCRSFQENLQKIQAQVVHVQQQAYELNFEGKEEMLQDLNTVRGHISTAIQDYSQKTSDLKAFITAYLEWITQEAQKMMDNPPIE